MRAKKNRTVPVHLLEAEDPMGDDVDSPDSSAPILEEVEQFLAEHEVSLPSKELHAVYDGHDVAKALAVTWKEKHKELTKLQRSRKFTQADQLKRSFRVDVEELKKKSRCRLCNQLGHRAMECKSTSTKGSGKQGHSASKASPSGAAFVESFVAMVDHMPSPLEWLRCHARNVTQSSQDSSLCHGPITPLAAGTGNPECVEQFLVSSPGFGVLDSGCGRSIIGEEILHNFWKILPKPA